jgi:hypothetical protein
MLDPNGAVVGAKPRHMRLFGARTAAWYLKAVLTFTDAMWLYAARSGTINFLSRLDALHLEPNRKCARSGFAMKGLRLK